MKKLFWLALIALAPTLTTTAHAQEDMDLAVEDAQIELGDVATPEEIYAELLEREDEADYLDAEPTARTTKDIGNFRLQIFVDKYTGSSKLQTATIFEDGVQTRQYLVSTGARGFNTPNGVFGVDRMEFTWTSTIYNARMDRAVFFNGGIALHATYGENIGLLGTRQSHGCVRQSPENADKTFALIKKYGPKNTVIIVRE